MKCDSHASLLAHIFVSLCLGHKPKGKVATFWTWWPWCIRGAHGVFCNSYYHLQQVAKLISSIQNSFWPNPCFNQLDLSITPYTMNLTSKFTHNHEKKQCINMHLLSHISRSNFYGLFLTYYMLAYLQAILMWTSINMLKKNVTLRNCTYAQSNWQNVGGKFYM